MEAAAGTLSLQGGDAGSTTGDFNGSGADGLVRFNFGGYTLETDVSLSGRIELTTNATLNVSGTVPITTGATFTQSGGTIGGAGTLTVSGSFNWSGGSQTDAGTTVIASGATLSIDTAVDNVFLSGGRTLQIDSGATASWSGQFGIWLADAATIENAGTFNANGAAIGDFNGGSGLSSCTTPATGTFRKSAGTGTLAVGVPFDNDGTVEAAAGTLSLARGRCRLYDRRLQRLRRRRPGPLQLRRLHAGDRRQPQRPDRAHDECDAERERDRPDHRRGHLHPIRRHDRRRRHAHGLGQLQLERRQPDRRRHDRDRLRGDALDRHRRGQRLPLGRAHAPDRLRRHRQLERAFGIWLADAATIENAGTFNANGARRSGSSTAAAGSGSCTTPATGTFRKSAGTGTLAVGVPFDNDGTVEAAAGTLSLARGRCRLYDRRLQRLRRRRPGPLRLRQLHAGDRRQPQRPDRAHDECDAERERDVPITAGATFTQSGGTIGGAGTLTVSGSFNWSGGSQTDAGTTVIASGATLSIDTAVDNVFLSGGRTLQIDSGATASWSGQFGIGLADAATIENAGTFNANGARRSGSSTAAAGQLVHNAATGTFRKSAGTGTLAVGVPFDNDGTVEIATGILGAASYTQSATGTLQVRIAGTAPGTGFGQLHVDGTAALAGTLRIVTASGFTPAEGNSFRIVDASSRTGVFSTVEGATTDGVEYSVQYDATGVTLVVGTAASNISIDDVSMAEGNSGQTAFNFTVSLSAPRPRR